MKKRHYLYGVSLFIASLALAGVCMAKSTILLAWAVTRGSSGPPPVDTVTITSMPTTGNTSTPIPFQFSYTGSQITGMTCVWNPGNVTGGIVTAFQAANGTGGGSCQSPSTINTYTMTATANQLNTASGIAPNTTVIGGAGACLQGSIYSDGCSGAVAAQQQSPALMGAAFSGSISGTALTVTTPVSRKIANGQKLFISGVDSGLTISSGAGTNWVLSSSHATVTNVTMTTVYNSVPLWNVAGVDYAVGVPTSVTLQDPTIPANLPIGATYSSSTHTVTVSGNNVTLNGFDFAAINGHNDTVLTVNGSNAVVKNSHFKVGPTACPTPGNCNATSINILGSNSSFLNNEVDGSDVDTSSTSQAGHTIGIGNGAGGNLIVRYNYMHNSGQDMIDINSTTTTQNDFIEYNLFQDIGTKELHSDTIQWFGAKIGPSSIGFNTVNYTVNVAGAGNGSLVELSEGSGATMTGMDEHNNTVLIPAVCSSGCNWGVGFYEDLGGVADHISIRNNFIDPTGLATSTNSPWFAGQAQRGTLPATFTLPNPMAMNDLTLMTTGANLPVPTFTAQTNFGFWQCPDINNYCPSYSDIYTITTPSTGNVTTGSVITFTMAMAGPPVWTVSTASGTPTISLNDGGAASYISGSGSNSLVFQHTVAAGNVANPLAITAINLNGGSIADGYGNSINASGPLTTYATLTINTGGGSVPNAPTGLTASSTTSSTIPLTWTAPTTGSPTAETVQYALHPQGGSNPWVTATNALGGNATSYTITGLTASTSYDVQVFGTNGSGNGAVDEITSVSTAAGSGACPMGNGFPADGCASAPPATIPHPGGYLAAHYAHRPPWNVAGFDYGVGIPTGTNLTPVNTASLPSGVTYSGGIMRCGSGTTATVTGIEFDVAGGTSVQPSGTCALTIQNSHFGCSTGTTFAGGYRGFLSVGSSSPLILTNNKLDAALCADKSGSPGSQMQAFGGGSVVAKYNWFINSMGEYWNSGPPAVVTFQFNLYDDNGPTAFDTHPNYLQWTGSGTYGPIVITYNGAYATQGGSETWQMYNNNNPGSTLNGATLSNNTSVILSGSGVVYQMYGAPSAQFPTPCTAPCLVQNNYYDVQSSAAFYTNSFPSGTWTSGGNTDMTTGATITPN